MKEVVSHFHMFIGDDYTSWEPNGGKAQVPFRINRADLNQSRKLYESTLVNSHYISIFRDNAGVVIGPTSSPPHSQSSRWWIDDVTTLA